MPSEATAKNAPPELDRYRRRDDFMRAYNPATAEQRLLLTQAFRAFEHLEQMYELRDHLTKGQGLIELFETNFEKYKLLLRHLAEAERMWRHAIEAFHKAQRRTASESRPSVTEPRVQPSGLPGGGTHTGTPPKPQSSNSHGLQVFELGQLCVRRDRKRRHVRKGSWPQMNADKRRLKTR